MNSKKEDRNGRTEKIFDIEAEEEDHKSIDKDNFAHVDETREYRILDFIQYE
jgi:hypothetical protein